MENKPFLNILLTSCILFFAIKSLGQEYKESKRVPFKKNISAYSIDANQNLFIGFNDGGLTKYDKTGNLLENYSLPNTSSISLIDVQNNLKPFIFHFDNQQITILDRFSSIPKVYHLANLGVQLGMLACPAPDGDIWILENNPQRLKKINPQRKSLTLELQMNLGDSLFKMQSYQNLVLIGTSQNLHILDQFGGKLYELNFDELIGFQISNEFLYAFTQSDLTKYDLYSGDKLETFKLPSYPSIGVMKTKNQFICLSKNEIVFYLEK